jgi:hypothetical protein
MQYAENMIKYSDTETIVLHTIQNIILVFAG